jgi:hypothetical protein
MPIDEFIITVFCLVVDMLDEILKEQNTVIINSSMGINPSLFRY